MPKGAAASTAELARLHALSFSSTPRPWSAAEIDSLIASPHVFLLSAPQGFLLGRALAGEAELLTLAVAPEARRHGIGRRLVADFLAEALARGAESAFLEVSCENQPAIALYEAAGFQRAGRRRGYYTGPEQQKIDALVMTLALAGQAPTAADQAG